jgi:hypothetical protein
MDMMEVDNGTSDVADGTIDVDEGLIFELDLVAPECNGAIWVSCDGLRAFEGCGFTFLSNPFESIDMFDKRSAAPSQSHCPRLPSPALSSRSSSPSVLAPALHTEPGILPSP